MLESIPVSLLVGAVLGFLSGLGIGGGSLLVLWMTLILGAAPETARFVNLLFFLPSALIAVCFRAKQGTLSIRKVLPAVIAGCCTAALISLFSEAVDTSLLRRGFGILLILTGVRELLYRPKDSP